MSDMRPSNPIYDKCLHNFLEFQDACDTSNIKFVFYTTFDKQLSAPKIRLAPLKRWTYENHTYYIARGYNNSYAYVYQQSDLRILVNIKRAVEPYAPGNVFHDPSSSSQNMTYDIDIVDRDGEEAFVGSHVDFSMSKKGSDDVLFKTHFTSYTNWGTPEAERMVDVCNFTMSSARDVLHTPCFSGDQRPTGATVETTYALAQRTAVKGLCKVVVSGASSLSGGRKIRIGTRGGRYVLVKGKRQYLRKPPQQRGGVAPVEYENVRMDAQNEPAVFDFLAQTCIQRVYELMGDRLEAARVFYDAQNELHERGHETVTILYEFTEDKTHVFHVNVTTLLRAFYATRHPERTVPKEQQCLTALTDFTQADLTDTAATLIAVAA